MIDRDPLEGVTLDLGRRLGILPTLWFGALLPHDRAVLFPLALAEAIRNPTVIGFGGRVFDALIQRIKDTSDDAERARLEKLAATLNQRRLDLDNLHHRIRDILALAQLFTAVNEMAAAVEAGKSAR